MLLLLFSFFSGIFACSPNAGGGPGAITSAISFKMDVSPPEKWTIPPSPDLAATSQSRTRQVARRRIRNDIQQSVSAILRQYNFPQNQATCTPTVQTFVQGNLTTGSCTANGQILSIDGTVYFSCSQVTQVRGKREADDDGELSTTTEIGDISESTTASTITMAPTTVSTPSTQTTTPTAPVSLACVFIMDWEYLGNNETAITSYNEQKDFITSVAEMLYNSTELKFAAIAGEFGYVLNGGGLSYEEPIHETYVDFLSHLREPSSIARTPYCDTLEEVKNYAQLDSSQRKCLIFVMGKNYTCPEEKTSGTRRRRQTDNEEIGIYDFAFTVTLNKDVTTTLPGSTPIDGSDLNVSSLVTRVTNAALGTTESTSSLEILTTAETLSSLGSTVTMTSPTSTTEVSQENGSTETTVSNSPVPTTTTTPITTTTSTPTTTTPVRPPSFIRHNVAMSISVNCTSLTPATSEMWTKFLQKLQQQLQKRKISFNKNLSL